MLLLTTAEIISSLSLITGDDLIMASVGGGKRQYLVSTGVFSELFNLSGGYFEQGQQSGWRQFYSRLEGKKIVTRSNRVNKKSINITGKHCRVQSRAWCPASFNFVAKLPIDRNASDVVFDLSIRNLSLCDCGMYRIMLRFGILTILL